jgi:hypothetical protein
VDPLGTACESNRADGDRGASPKGCARGENRFEDSESRALFRTALALVGATVRPTIWPTAILNEGDSLAFDILLVASPDPGSDLTVVIQT